MTTLEDQLTRHLHQRANQAELSFTIDDITTNPPAPPVAPTRRTAVRTVLAGAAAVVVVLAAAVLAKAGDSPDQVQTTPLGQTSPDTTTGSGPAEQSVTERINELRQRGALFGLEPSDASPARLEAATTVLAAEGVGLIEIGPPNQTDAANSPAPLDDGHCVAVGNFIGCSGPLSDAPDQSYPTRVHLSEGDFTDDPDVLVITDLPETAVLVEASFDGLTVGQIPLARTAALAVPFSTTQVTVQAIDARNRTVCQHVIEFGQADEPASADSTWTHEDDVRFYAAVAGCMQDLGYGNGDSSTEALTELIDTNQTTYMECFDQTATEFGLQPGPADPGLHPATRLCVDAMAEAAAINPDGGPALVHPDPETAGVVIFEHAQPSTTVQVILLGNDAIFSCEVVAPTSSNATVAGISGGPANITAIPEPDSILVLDRAWSSNSGPEDPDIIGPGDTHAFGRAGTNVTHIAIELPDGTLTPGAIRNGWFMVDTPIPDGVPLFEEQLVWTLTNGQTHTAPADSLTAPN